MRRSRQGAVVLTSGRVAFCAIWAVICSGAGLAGALEGAPAAVIQAGEELPWLKGTTAVTAREQPKAVKPKFVISVGIPGSGYKMASSSSSFALISASFSDLPGWANDDHLAALKAFIASCPAVIERASSKKREVKPATRALAEICRFALADAGSGRKASKAAARMFFETHFKPRRVEQSIREGMLTGYYEPLLKASRTPTAEYKTPLYRRPDDLINVVAESERGAKSANFTHMRKTADGLKPYLTRAEIERGALAGQGLELLYFRDPVDVYFLQVQGSGHIELSNGEKTRVSYDGKNGYPYTSIGRELIEAGTFTPDTMSLKALSKWLKADRARAEPVMWKNQSYVFFRELKGTEAEGAMGALGTPLKAGRSLAVDTAYHTLGMPVYVVAPSLKHAGGENGFNRLMVAQDVGSAIKGPERGDIYFGSGEKAGRIAGTTKHPGHFFVLEPAPVIEARKGSDGSPAP